uniref:integrase core domain-containing protein n=1 Tax=Zoogloea sp. TaxID=49181 RepID=UPI0035B3088C
GGYGRVRFHHRSVLEFLAACQIHDLIEAGLLSQSAAARLVFGLTPTNCTELVLGALNRALATGKPEGVIHHSDQGSQDAYDNAMAESLFASLECELIDRRSVKTKTEARLAVFAWIEGWYNPRRRHSALGYRSTMNFEQRHRDKENVQNTTIECDLSA